MIAKSWRERATDWAAERRLLPPFGRPRPHPVFAAFPPPPQVADGGDVDYLGIRTLPEMLPPHWVTGPRAGALPAVGEEYFEWIDLLESVDNARTTFTMIEFGAGYARWFARASVAASRRGLATRFGVVEAEPQHAQWARSHLAANGVAQDDVAFFDAAVGTAPGRIVFLVGMPPGTDGNNAREWYGQAVAWDGLAVEQDTGRTYHGRALLALADGWTGVEVPVVDIRDIMARFETIYFADFDVQGAEAEVIGAAVAELTAQVRRLHIGTHSRAIDAELPRILGSAGWRCLRAYPCLRWNRTEFGWIRFTDGVQSWINPRLG
jgi:FkbM family methyltransferase